MKIWFAAVIMLLLGNVLPSASQGLKPPPSGKAAVYFVRLSNAGFAISFDFYDGKKFIGEFSGRNYMRYEADPGEHLFWAASENQEFMTADLKADAVYVVIVNVEMGDTLARVGLTPITASNKQFEKVMTLVEKKSPRNKKPEELKAGAASRAQAIEEALAQYKENEKKTHKHLSANMAIDLKM